MANDINYATLLEYAPCGFVVFNDKGILTYVNHTLADWIESTTDDLINKNIQSLLTLSSKIFYGTHFFPLLKLQSEVHEIFLTLRTKSSGDIPVMVNAKLDQTTGFFHCVMVPIKQRSQFEERLINARQNAEKALSENIEILDLKERLEENVLTLDHQYQRLHDINKDLIEFNKIISHDLQEPVRKIQVFSDRIQNGSSSNLSEQSISDVGRIQHAAGRLKLLITGLQQFVEIDFESKSVRINLTDLINNAFKKSQDIHHADDVHLIIERSVDIIGSQEQMALLFFHLVDNAIKFRSPDRPLEIAVSVTTLNENVFKWTREKYKYLQYDRITFTDNGMGFDLKFRDKVIEVFNKLNPKSAGIGIGLAIVKRIANNHSGVFEISSEPGRGTTVTIVLPRTNELKDQG